MSWKKIFRKFGRIISKIANRNQMHYKEEQKKEQMKKKF